MSQLDAAALGYGFCRALTGPAGAALPPRLVAGEDLLAANSVLGAAATTGQVLGPVAASVTLALSGFRAAFVVDAVTYLVGAAAVASLPLLLVASPERRVWRAELAEGIRVAVHNRAIRKLLAVGTAVSFTSGSFLVVEPLYARLVLHRPPSQFALFEAAAGIGGVLAGLGIPRLRARLAGPRVFSLGAAAYGLTAATFIDTTWVAVAYAGAVLWGVAGAVFWAVALTSLQRLSAMHTHGRVMALRSSLTSAADTVGLPIAAVILATLGTRPGAIVLAAVAVGAGTISLSRRLPEAEAGGQQRAR